MHVQAVTRTRFEAGEEGVISDLVSAPVCYSKAVSVSIYITFYDRDVRCSSQRANSNLVRMPSHTSVDLLQTLRLRLSFSGTLGAIADSKLPASPTVACWFRA